MKIKGKPKHLRRGATIAMECLTMNPILFNHSVSCINRKARGLVLVAGLVAAGVCFSVTSCATAHGFGQDVSHVGQKIEQKADR